MHITPSIRSRVWPALRLALLAATASTFALAANATIVFDSFFAAPAATHRVYTQCFICTAPNDTNNIVQMGDIIQFGGTARNLTTVMAGLEQVRFAGTTAMAVDATMSLYTVDAGLHTSLIAARTLNLSLLGAGLVDLAFNFTGVTVPNQIYYGLSLTSTDANIAGLRFSLWDYYDTSLFGDGQTLPVGTDPGTVVHAFNSVDSFVYGRLATPATAGVLDFAGPGHPNGLGVNDLSTGFTPSVRFEAVQGVPEPGSMVLVLGALMAAGLITRRRA